MIMGILSGSIPWFTMMVLHKKIRLLKKVDDTLAVLHTHAVAGILGGLLTSLFADPRLTRLFFGEDPRHIGLLYSFTEHRAAAGFRQLAMQIAGIALTVAINVPITSAICLFVRLFVPLRFSDDILVIGDDAIHGEDAYEVWGEGKTYEKSIHGMENMMAQNQGEEMA